MATTVQIVIQMDRLVMISVTFEFNAVVALFNSDSRSVSSTGDDMSETISTALEAACWNDSEIVVG